MSRFQITQSSTDAPLRAYSSGCRSPFSARLSLPGPGGGLPERSKAICTRFSHSLMGGLHSTHLHINTQPHKITSVANLSHPF